MTEQEFKTQAIEWLKPFGYGVHSHNDRWTYIAFICFDKLGENYPSIICRYEELESTVDLSDNSLKLFISIEARGLAFLHKDIERWINAIKHYSDVCQQFPLNLK